MGVTVVVQDRYTDGEVFGWLWSCWVSLVDFLVPRLLMSYVVVNQNKTWQW